MLGNIAEQNTPDSAIVNTTDGKTVIAQFDAHELKTIAPGDPVCVASTGRKMSPWYWITDVAACFYYRRYWDEDSTGPCKGWGGSSYLFEVHEDGWVSRQIQIFDNGRFILYDEIRNEDDYGFRSKVQLDPKDFDGFRITQEQFFRHWDPDASVNRGAEPGG